jgi:HEAT repeat protein
MTETSPDPGVRAEYTEPVRRLLSLGESWENDPAKWPDYAEKFRLMSKHIPELIRLAGDAALYGGDQHSTEAWAPVHAWRALGRLRAEASVPPLLAFLKASGNDDDWAHIELPLVLGLIGAAAIAPVATFIRDQSNSTFPAATAILGLKEIARGHPACRGECIDVLVRLLGQRGDTHPTLKGCAVSALIDLEAVEAIDVIRDAFRRKSVDISVAGDEEDVEIELRLREHRATPAPNYQLLPASRLERPDESLDTDVSPRNVKVGRNDPCPCGSGKKYKKCCLA